MVEGGTPNTLLRRGLTRDSLTTGTELVVDGYQTKDHSLKRANGRDVTFTDGRKMFMGSSGTGAPRDGAIRPKAGRRSPHRLDKVPRFQGSEVPGFQSATALWNLFRLEGCQG